MSSEPSITRLTEAAAATPDSRREVLLPFLFLASGLSALLAVGAVITLRQMARARAPSASFPADTPAAVVVGPEVLAEAANPASPATALARVQVLAANHPEARPALAANAPLLSSRGREAKPAGEPNRPVCAYPPVNWVA